MEKAISKDGTPIGYHLSGGGSPLVLVHGTIGDHNRWAPVLPALEKRFTVYAVDRRGRPLSGDADKYSIEREFEDIAAIVDSIGVGVNLLGHSSGGMCAIGAALLTSNVRNLVVYEGWPSGGNLIPPEMIQRLQIMADHGQKEQLLTTFMRDLIRLPADQLEQTQALADWSNRVAAAHTIPRELRTLDYVFDSERLKGIQARTLLLVGGNNLSRLKESAEAILQVLADSRMNVMPDQGHNAIDTAPDLFVREVVGFLTESD